MEEKQNEFEKTIKDLRSMRNKYRFLINILVFGIVIVTSISALVYFILKKEISGVINTQTDQYTEHKITNQFLLSTIDWSALRTKKILYMRDIIVNDWKRRGLKVDMDEAYLIAETDVKKCENFPQIDPFIVLAMQSIESAFIKGQVSPMGAIGLNQIMPATGRLLCGFYGMAYSDSTLFDIKSSTHLAVKLIDVLYAQYGQWDLTLAAYNGGPYQAHYYSKEKAKLSAETAAYVPAVLAKSKQYTEGFIKYRIDLKMTSQIIDTSTRR